MSVTAEAPTMTPVEGITAANAGAAASPADPSPLLLLDRAALKALLKEAVVEVFQERREEFASFLIETYEDACLAAAMDEGMESGLADPQEVEAYLASFRGSSNTRTASSATSRS